MPINLKGVKIISDRDEDFYSVELEDGKTVATPTMKDKRTFTKEEYQSYDCDFVNQLFSNAVFYFNAAITLRNEWQKADIEYAHELSPICSLLSFSCELFLKWLIFDEKRSRKECIGHALRFV